MLYEAYVSHLKSHPRSPLGRIPFEKALECRGLFICLKNLAAIAARRRAERAHAERPTLDLT